MVAGDPLVRPRQRRSIDEPGRERAAVHPHPLSVHGAKAREVQALAGGEANQGLLALAHDDDVAAELAQRRARRGRAVRADRDRQAADAGQGPQGLRRHPQLRLGAAPEQVGGRGGDHRHLRREVRHRPAQVVQRTDPRRWASSSSTSWPARHQHRPGVAELQRQVRLAAAEVDAALEAPARVDQGDPHRPALPAANTGTALSASRPGATPVGPNRLSSHCTSRPTPASTPTLGRQPVAALNLPVSET